VHGVAANHSEPLYHVTTTSLYVIGKLDVVDESVNNKQFMQLSTASLIDAYHEPTLWDSNVNVTEEDKDLSWYRQQLLEDVWIHSNIVSKFSCV